MFHRRPAVIMDATQQPLQPKKTAAPAVHTDGDTAAMVRALAAPFA